MKKVVVTGANGFLGSYLTQQMVLEEIEVYAIVRSHEKAKQRFKENIYIHIIELDMKDISQLVNLIPKPIDVFYHLAWNGERNAFEEQTNNIHYAVEALEVAAKLGCQKVYLYGLTS